MISGDDVFAGFSKNQAVGAAFELHCRHEMAKQVGVRSVDFFGTPDNGDPDFIVRMHDGRKFLVDAKVDMPGSYYGMITVAIPAVKWYVKRAHEEKTNGALLIVGRKSDIRVLELLEGYDNGARVIAGGNAPCYALPYLHLPKIWDYFGATVMV